MGKRETERPQSLNFEGRRRKRKKQKEKKSDNDSKPWRFDPFALYLPVTQNLSLCPFEVNFVNLP